MIKLKIKKLNDKALLPEYAHEGDAGMDIFSCENVKISPLKRAVISTGFAVELPRGTEMQIRSKSGMAANYGVFVLNSPATIDENYRGEIKVILQNMGEKDFEIKVGQKIAQILISKVNKCKVVEVEETSRTNRGEGGLGSTGLFKKSK